MKCKILDCPTESKYKGGCMLCYRHYYIKWKYGDPLYPIKRTEHHGMKYSPEYKSWRAMKQRCYYPKAKDYKYWGGRGIKVCDEWLNSFSAFYRDMGKRPSLEYTLDRINGDGNYEPGNCRWASKLEQRSNRRAKVLTV